MQPTKPGLRPTDRPPDLSLRQLVNRRTTASPNSTSCSSADQCQPMPTNQQAVINPLRFCPSALHRTAFSSMMTESVRMPSIASHPPLFAWGRQGVPFVTLPELRRTVDITLCRQQPIPLIGFSKSARGLAARVHERGGARGTTRLPAGWRCTFPVVSRVELRSSACVVCGGDDVSAFETSQKEEAHRVAKACCFATFKTTIDVCLPVPHFCCACSSSSF